MVTAAMVRTGMEWKVLSMNEQIREQIMAIRDSGITNMIDVNRVQREANDRGYYALVIFIEEHRSSYIRFIMFGDDG